MSQCLARDLAIGALCAATAVGFASGQAVHRLGEPPALAGPPPPVAAQPAPAGAATGLTVDRFSRSDVVAFWNTAYLASEGVDPGWTGNVSTCDAGTLNAAHLDAMLRRINYYRAMAGLPGDIVFDATLSAQCQEAALMMIAEGDLSHTPPMTWACWTSGGADAAAASNLTLGQHGPAAIDRLMEDDGVPSAGHRRWFLLSNEKVMGAGSTTAQNGPFTGSAAVWVTDSTTFGPTLTQFVEWPPAGFVPHAVVFGMWSLSHPDADFTGASVTMTQGGSAVPVSIVSRESGPFPDPSLIWEPSGIPTGPPAQDTTYTVTVANILIGGAPQTHVYDVTIIDPTQVTLPTVGEMLDALLDRDPAAGPFDLNSDGREDCADLVTLINQP